MAWIEVHQSLWTHRKTLLLATALDMEATHAAAHLIRLWTWALDNAPSGDLSGLPPQVIAFGADWKQDPLRFVQALIDTDWIDEHDEARDLHDWLDYAGRLIEKRQANAVRMRAARARNVSRTCAPCAGATVPNRTQPYPTSSSGEYDPCADKATASPPPPRPPNGRDNQPPAIETPLGYYLAQYKYANPQQTKDLQDMEEDCGHECSLAALRWAARNGMTDTGKIWDLAIKMKTEGIGNKPTPMAPQRPRDVDDDLNRRYRNLMPEGVK